VSSSDPRDPFFARRDKPLDRTPQTLLERGKGESREMIEQEAVRDGLFELPVRERLVQTESDARDVRNLLRHIEDAHLVGGGHREDHEGRVPGVLLEEEDHERGNILAENELAHRPPGSADDEVGAVLSRQDGLVDEGGDHVRVLEVEIVVGAVDVGGDDARKVVPELLAVRAAVDLEHPLGVRVRLIRRVRRSLVEHGFIDRVLDRVREDACREAGDEFLHAEDVAEMDDVRVDEEVLLEHIDLLVHVLVEPADVRGQVDDIIGPYLAEHPLGLPPDCQIVLPARDKHEPERESVGDGSDGIADQPAPAGHQDGGHFLSFLSLNELNIDREERKECRLAERNSTAV